MNPFLKISPVIFSVSSSKEIFVEDILFLDLSSNSKKDLSYLSTLASKKSIIVFYLTPSLIRKNYDIIISIINNLRPDTIIYFLIKPEKFIFFRFTYLFFKFVLRKILSHSSLHLNGTFFCFPSFKDIRIIFPLNHAIYKFVETEFFRPTQMVKFLKIFLINVFGYFFSTFHLLLIYEKY